MSDRRIEYPEPSQWNRIVPVRKTTLIALVTFAVLGCSRPAPDPVQMRASETALIQATVTDPARIESLLALLQERDRLIEETRAMTKQYRRELKSLNADYDSSREIMIEMIDYYNRERAQKLLRFIELIAKMKAKTSAEEWQAIAEFQLEYFNPRQLIFNRSAGGI